MVLPAAFPLTMTQINDEFGRGLDLYAYRGTSHTTGTFPTGTIAFSDFLGKAAGATLLGYYTGRLNFGPPSIVMDWTGSIAVGPYTCTVILFSPTPNSPAGTQVHFPAGRPGTSCRLHVAGIYDGTSTAWGDWYGTPMNAYTYPPIGSDFSGNRDVEIWVYS
jgi:hypothetical protein